MNRRSFLKLIATSAAIAAVPKGAIPASAQLVDETDIRDTWANSGGTRLSESFLEQFEREVTRQFKERGSKLRQLSTVEYTRVKRRDRKPSWQHYWHTKIDGVEYDWSELTDEIPTTTQLNKMHQQALKAFQRA